MSIAHSLQAQSLRSKDLHGFNIKLALKEPGPFLHIQLSPQELDSPHSIWHLKKRALDLWRAELPTTNNPENILVKPRVVLTFRDAENDACVLLTHRDLKNAFALFPPHCTLRIFAHMNDDGPQPEIVEVKTTYRSRWIKHKTLTYNCLKDYIDLHREPMHGTFGGRLDQREQATGFFRVQRLTNRWTFIDPDGRPFVCAALNSVAPCNLHRDYKEAFDEKFGGDLGVWARETYDFVFNDVGVNVLGCWSDQQTFNDNGIYAPYCPQWNFMLTYAGSRYRLSVEGVIPVFDPEFEAHCDQRAKELIAPIKDDPWLLGHFSDNELPLKEINIIKMYLKLDKTDPGHQYASAWLEERNMTPDDITVADNKEFATLVISRYYRIVSEAIKKYDPNHLFIGSRFHGGVLVQDSAWVACGPFVDVVSANYYHRWTADQREIDRWCSLSGRPIFMTEWYAKGEDSGLPNERGAGFSVAVQADRGKFYENYVLSLMRNPNVVGWHWFHYLDSTGANVGLYDLKYNPWPELSASFRNINSRLYSLSDYMAKANDPIFMDEDETVPDDDETE